MATDATLTSELDAYKVDFTWKKLSFLISDSKTDRQIFIGDCKAWTKPHIKFLSPDKELVGEASIHTVSIHADCEIRGRHKKIQAMKRWKTEYTYLSDAFADGGLPVAMYWTSSSGKFSTKTDDSHYLPSLTTRKASNIGTSSFWTRTKKLLRDLEVMSGQSLKSDSLSSWATTATRPRRRLSSLA